MQPKPAANIGQRHAFFDAQPAILHKPIELLFRCAEGRRHQLGVAKAARSPSFARAPDAAPELRAHIGR